MTAAWDLLISVLALVGVAWSAHRIISGRASRSLFMTANVGLLCLLVLVWQLSVVFRAPA